MTAAVTSGPDAVSSDLRCPHASRHRPHAVSTRRPNMLRHRLIGWPRDLEKFSLFFPIGPKARSTRTRSTRSPIAHGRAGAVVCCLSHSQHIECAPIALSGRPPGTAHSRHHCPDVGLFQFSFPPEHARGCRRLRRPTPSTSSVLGSPCRVARPVSPAVVITAPDRRVPEVPRCHARTHCLS